MTALRIAGATSLAAVLFAGVADAQVFDHLKCYKIKDAAKFDAMADLGALQAEFGMDSCRIKGRGKLFCVPASKTVTAFEDRSREGIPQVAMDGQALDDDRICYKLKCPVTEIDDRIATDQFGTRQIGKFKLTLLCTPAIKGLPPTTSTTTTTTSTLPPAPKRVFVTSGTYEAFALGGLAGADSICNAAAAAASLPGTYMAWLSNTTDGPATRFATHHTGAYELVDGTVIADDWADLTDGALLAPIDVDETGAQVSDFAWTNTRFDGTPHCTSSSPTAACECTDWSTTTGSNTGFLGSSVATTAQWSTVTTRFCSRNFHRLYCFEQ